MEGYGSWSHGLCSCCNDCGACCCAYCCTPCQFHANASRVGVPCGCCLWYIPFVNCCCFAHVRGKVRKRSHISGSCPGDCLVHCCCHCCALVQESQELDVADSLPAMAAPVDVTVVNVQPQVVQGIQSQSQHGQPTFAGQPQVAHVVEQQPGYATQSASWGQPHVVEHVYAGQQQPGYAELPHCQPECNAYSQTTYPGPPQAGYLEPSQPGYLNQIQHIAPPPQPSAPAQNYHGLPPAYDDKTCLNML